MKRLFKIAAGTLLTLALAGGCAAQNKPVEEPNNPPEELKDEAKDGTEVDDQQVDEETEVENQETDMKTDAVEQTKPADQE